MNILEALNKLEGVDTVHPRPFKIETYDDLVKRLKSLSDEAQTEARKIREQRVQVRMQMEEAKPRPQGYGVSREMEDLAKQERDLVEMEVQVSKQFFDDLKALADEVKGSVPELAEMAALEEMNLMNRWYFSSPEEQQVLETQSLQLTKLYGKYSVNDLAEVFTESVNKTDKAFLYWVDHYYPLRQDFLPLLNKWKDTAVLDRPSNLKLQRIYQRREQF
jgi:hypothetical protein